jgi:hypothetical protein
MTSLTKIAVERMAKNMIKRKTIVTMMTKRITITKRRGRGRGQERGGAQGVRQ